jgi:hypothetical protein
MKSKALYSHLLVAILLGGAWTSTGFAQTITRAEYFFDADPGVGNATALPVTPGAAVNETYSLNINTLATGFHTFNARVRDNTGKWSLFTTRTFYIIPNPFTLTPATQLTRAEYFFDTDPGVGNGVSIPFPASPSLSLTISAPTTSLTPGFHTVNVRVRDNQGRWSMFTTRSFYLLPTGTLPTNLVRVEYFVGTDPGVGQATAINVTAAPTINNLFALNLPTLTPGGYTLTVRVKDSNGFWSNAVTAPFTIAPCTNPPPPAATGDSRCGPGSVTLTASGANATQEYRWYADATTTTVLATASTFTTPNLTLSTTYFVAIYDWSGCESTRTAVTATINVNPSAPTTTGANRCGPGSVTLSASGGSAGQYRWYTVATGGTAITGETNATFTTPSLTANTDYFVAINDGTCESTRTLVSAVVNAIPAAPTTTGANRCGPGSVTLSASGGSAGQYRWYTVATGGTAIVGETNSTFTTPSLSANTDYFVAINDGTCESTRTPMSAVVNAIPAAPTTTGANRCGSGSVTLTASGGSAGQYRWYTAATGSLPLTGETNATFTTPSLTANTDYFVAINDGTCESARTLVSAVVNAIPAPPTTTGANRCGPGSVTLSASGGSAGQYRWYTVATGGTAITGETNATFTTPSLTANTDYFVAINDGTCESARTSVTAIVNSTPAKPVISASGPLAFCSGQNVTLTAPAGFTYLWSNNATTQQITVSTAGSFTVVVSFGGCASVASDPAVVVVTNCTTNQPPVITTTASQSAINGSTTISLVALLSDPDNNLDLNTLRIVSPPRSGATASIGTGGILTVNYQGLAFSGTDELTIEVCDLAGLCVQQRITIEVIGDIVVYNGISPNGDGKTMCG